MGLFGLFYTTFVSIGLIVDNYKKEKENNKCKSQFKHPDNLTYTDREGKSRLLSNNELVFYTLNDESDYILEDLSGRVIKNFTKEEKEKQQNKVKFEACQIGKSTYPIEEGKYNKTKTPKGKRFKDFETGEVYIIRCINSRYYFMNINTGLLVRETDWQKQYNIDNQHILKFQKGVNIKEFNNKQKEIDKQSLLFRDFDYNSSCDYRN